VCVTGQIAYFPRPFSEHLDAATVPDPSCCATCRGTTARPGPVRYLDTRIGLKAGGPKWSSQHKPTGEVRIKRRGYETAVSHIVVSVDHRALAFPQ
jgi:hypothetical protein